MKRRAPIFGLLAITLSLGLGTPSNAEGLSSYLEKVPGSASVDLRQAEIEKRLREAVAAGRISQLDSQEFSRELDKVADLEAAYRASHGKLSLWENLKLLYQLDNLSRKVEQSLSDRQVADSDLGSRIVGVQNRIEDGLNSKRLTEQEASGFKYDLERIQSLHQLLTSSSSSSIRLTDAQSLQLALDLDRLSSRLESTMHDRQIELPEIDKAQDEIAARLAAALDKGILSKDEADDLKEEFQKVAEREATLKSYGRPLTSEESLALAVDLEKISRELDLKMRTKDTEGSDYKDKEAKVSARIAAGVVTGKLTLAEASYLKDRLEKLEAKATEWRKQGEGLSADESRALLLDLEKLSIQVERRLNDPRYSWMGLSKAVADLQIRMEAAKEAGRISEADLTRLNKDLDKIKANWEQVRAAGIEGKGGSEGTYPLKDTVYIVFSLDQLSDKLADTLSDRDVELPELEARKTYIDQRIAAGVVSGRLTPDEGQRLLDEFDRINEKESVFRASKKELSERDKLALAVMVEKLSTRVERSIHEGARYNPGFEQLRQKMKDAIEEGIIAGSIVDEEAEKLKAELLRIESSEKSFRGMGGDLTASQALTVAQSLVSLQEAIEEQLLEADTVVIDLDKRREQLAQRISEGVVAGKLSAEDAESLRKEFERLDSLNKKYASSGGLSKGESVAMAYSLARLGSRIEEKMKDDRIALPSLKALHDQIDQRLAKSIASGALTSDRVKEYKDRLEAIARMEMGFRYTGDGLSYPESMMLANQLDDLNRKLDSALSGKSPSFAGIEDRLDKVGKRIADGIVGKKIDAEAAGSLKTELDRISNARVAFAHSEGGYNLEETETLVRDIDRLNSEIDLHMKGQKLAWSDIDNRQTSLEKTLKQLISQGKIKGADARVLLDQLDKIKRAKAAFTLSDGNLNYFERVSLGEALDNFNRAIQKSAVK